MNWLKDFKWSYDLNRFWTGKNFRGPDFCKEVRIDEHFSWISFTLNDGEEYGVSISSNTLEVTIWELKTILAEQQLSGIKRKIERMNYV